MPEAWVVRSYQRQEFLRKLMRKTCEAEEKFKEKGVLFFVQDLVVVTVEYLEDGGIPRRMTGPWFTAVVIPDVEHFARSLLERDALLALFLKDHLLPAALSRVFANLQREEFEHPEIIFHAEGPMEDMPFPDDS